MSKTWDRAIRPVRVNTVSVYVRLNFPTDLSRSLLAKNYNRVRIELTDDGILLKPYHAEDQTANDRGEPIELPEAWA